MPTLILVGATDFVCSPKMAAILQAGIPGSTLVVLPRSGHYGHVEAPAAFARAVRGFVEQVLSAEQPQSNPASAQ